MSHAISGQLGSAALGHWGLGWAGPVSGQQARIDSFTADNYGPVTPGTVITLSWVTEFATTVTLNPGVGTVGASGSTPVSPSATTTYILTATDGVNTATRSITIQVTSPAIFVRVSGAGPSVSSSISCGMQLDLGDLVVVAAYSNTANGNNNLTVTDNLGNSYRLDVQGARGTFDPSPSSSTHSGSLAIWSTIVTHAGSATITSNATTVGDVLGIIASEWVPPAGMAFAQGAKMIGDSAPDATPPGYPQFYGTAPVNLANSLVVTIIIDGFGLTFTSVEGDTKRAEIPGQAFSGHGGFACAMFDRILAGPGTRNSNVTASPFDPINVPFGFGAPNMLVACYSAPLVRPTTLDSQANVMPSLGSTVVGYGGQPVAYASLGYLPEIGSLVVVAAQGAWDLNGANLPPFTVTDTYGNTYTRLVHWEGVVINGVAMTQAAALWYTVVAFRPVKGVFTASVVMAPVNFNGPGCIAIAEYAINNLNPVDLQSAVLLTRTADGSQTLTFSTDLTVAARSLIAGFGVATAIAGNNVPTPFVPIADYAIDTQWDTAQVFVTPLTSWPTMGTGSWIHKYVDNAGTYDGQSLTTGNFLSGITMFSIPAPGTSPTLPLALACPVDGGSGTVGIFYSHQMVASGGTPPYHHFHVISGALPPGLVMNDATGLIHGIPTTPGTFTFTTEVTDSTGLTTKETCTIVISEVPTGGFCFKLLKVIATLVPARHLPTRGSVT